MANRVVFFDRPALIRAGGARPVPKASGHNGPQETDAVDGIAVPLSWPARRRVVATAAATSSSSGVEDVSGKWSVRGGTASVLWRAFLPPRGFQAPSPPVVILHGGPGVPHNYLAPLAASLAARGRPALLYDQCGCGGSTREGVDLGVAAAVDEVRDVLAAATHEPALAEAGFATGATPAHLLGQSWGGLLAFEHVSREGGVVPRSLVLSSAPASVPLVLEEAARLVDGCGGDVDVFYDRHYVRVRPHPTAFVDALALGGSPPWRGSDAIADWAAPAEPPSGWPIGLDTLLVIGEADFTTEVTQRGWLDAVPRSVLVVVPRGGHLMHLEPDARDDYVDALETFFRGRD